MRLSHQYANLPPTLWIIRIREGAKNPFCGLHCTALYYTLIQCTALHSDSLHCTALYFYSLHYTALHCTVIVCTSLHCTDDCIGYSTVDSFVVGLSLEWELLRGMLTAHCSLLTTHCSRLRKRDLVIESVIS